MMGLFESAVLSNPGVFATIFVAMTGTSISDTNHQAAIPANAPVCMMETVKAEGGNYHYSRQKPGVCRM